MTEFGEPTTALYQINTALSIGLQLLRRIHVELAYITMAILALALVILHNNTRALRMELYDMLKRIFKAFLRKLCELAPGVAEEILKDVLTSAKTPQESRDMKGALDESGIELNPTQETSTEEKTSNNPQ